MGLGTIFGFHKSKPTNKQRLCKFAQPGLSCNSRGPVGIGLRGGRNLVVKFAMYLKKKKIQIVEDDLRSFLKGHLPPAVNQIETRLDED